MEYRLQFSGGTLLCALLFALFSSCSAIPVGDCEEGQRNDCGGCAYFLGSLGDRCGPCGTGELQCDGSEELFCDDPLPCGIGATCANDEDCTDGICVAERCAPEGMSYIPAGRFLRGSPPRERGRVDVETQHTVTLTRHFAMQQVPVTQGDFQSLMGFNPSFFDNCGDQCPVESVTFFDALAYANALSEAKGFAPCYDLRACTGEPGNRFRCDPVPEVSLDCPGYRLPTEAEWEYAYRADTTTPYFFGDTEDRNGCEQPEIAKYALFCGNCESDYGQGYDCSNDGARPHMNSFCGTAQVGERLPNPWGLYDLAGNVYEFVWDAFDEYPEGALVDPKGPDHAGRLQVIRGAGFCGHRDRLRAADRKQASRNQPSEGNGFRLVRTLQEASDEELEREGSCNNGCGGCTPLDPGPGTPCGPCGIDQYICDGISSTVCDGATECNLGETCSADDQCDTGHCSNGYCSLREMSFIPAGRYLRGSPTTERRRQEGEDLHDVTISRHFFLDQTNITQEKWRSLMGYSPAYFRECGADCPIESITWTETLAFANARSRAEGLEECYDLSECTGTPGDQLRCPATIDFSLDCTGYRLPTDAEWEYAYRADSETALHNGNPSTAAACDQPLLDEIAHYCGNCEVDYESDVLCNDRPCGIISVAQRAPNPWGLYDMSGNVGEFVFDAFVDYPDQGVIDPIEWHFQDSQATTRNSGFCGQLTHVRGARRNSTTRIAANNSTGFRLARTFREATAEELDREGSCNNGCGGCAPLADPPGKPCGPCGADQFQCVSESETTCSGATSCNLGATCSDDSDCVASHCSNGFCAQFGYEYIPPGTFLMGSPPDERGRIEDLEDQFQVTISRPFLMATTPMTQELFTQVMGYNPSFFTGCGGDCPVESLSWLDSLAFANELSDLHGLERCYDLSTCTGEPGNRFRCPRDLSFSLDCSGFRLPTEAEWEYAYRANTTTAFYSGEVETSSACEQPLIEEIARFCGNCSVSYSPTFDCSNGGQRPHMPSDCGTGPVGEFQPNSWGLFDLSGQVEEFTWDVFAPYPEGPAMDPKGTLSEGFERVVRGGTFCGHMARLRGADRKFTNDISARQGTGVRLVRSLD